MPSFDVIIGPNGLAVNAPVFAGEDRAGNPRLTDVLNKLLEGVRGHGLSVGVSGTQGRSPVLEGRAGPSVFLCTGRYRHLWNKLLPIPDLEPEINKNK